MLTIWRSSIFRLRRGGRRGRRCRSGGGRSRGGSCLHGLPCLGTGGGLLFGHLLGGRRAAGAGFCGRSGCRLLRVGLGIGWTAVIVSEMVAGKSGLGYVLWDAYYVGRMDVVIADMASIGLLGFLSDRLIIVLENWVLGWHRLQSFQA